MFAKTSDGWRPAPRIICSRTRPEATCGRTCSLNNLRSSVSLIRVGCGNCGVGVLAMITESQIRERLFAYLTRNITLNDFEDWLVIQSRNMHLDSDDAAQSLVGAIELRLAEYSDDHLDDDSLERELKGLIASPIKVRIEESRATSPEVAATSFNGPSQAFSVQFALAA